MHCFNGSFERSQIQYDIGQRYSFLCAVSFRKNSRVFGAICAGAFSGHDGFDRQMLERLAQERRLKSAAFFLIKRLAVVAAVSESALAFSTKASSLRRGRSSSMIYSQRRSPSASSHNLLNTARRSASLSFGSSLMISDALTAKSSP
jgi:hypothetical protein